MTNGSINSKKTPISGPSLANLEPILDTLFSSLAPPSTSLYLEICDDAISFIGAAVDRVFATDGEVSFADLWDVGLWLAVAFKKGV